VPGNASFSIDSFCAVVDDWFRESGLRAARCDPGRDSDARDEAYHRSWRGKICGDAWPVAVSIANGNSIASRYAICSAFD